MTSIYIHNVDNPTMLVEWKQDSMGGVYSLTTIHTPEADIHMFSTSKPVTPGTSVTDLKSFWHGHPMESGHFWVLVTERVRRFYNSIDGVKNGFKTFGGDIYEFDFESAFLVNMENYDG